MLAFLTAAAAAVPTVVKLVKDIRGAEQKASTAAKVAADPNAPPAVQQAATNVATQAIDDKAAAEKAALAEVAARTPAPAATTSNMVPLLVIGAAVLLLGKRR
jgi:hypothetical protein